MGAKPQEMCKVCGNPNPAGQRVFCGSEECSTIARRQYVSKYLATPKGKATLAAGRGKVKAKRSTPEYREMLRKAQKKWRDKVKLAQPPKEALPAKPCLHCGTPFVPVHHEEDLCSANCRKERHRTIARDSLRAKVLKDRQAKGLPTVSRWVPGGHPLTCQHPGCEKPYYSRDLCHAHYLKARRDGTTLVKRRAGSVNQGVL